MPFGCFCLLFHTAILPHPNIRFKSCNTQNIFPKNAVTIFISAHKINHKQHLEGTNMSDLTATHCGCNNTSTTNNGCGCSSWIWILILLSCCGNNGDGCGCGNSFFGNGLFGGNDNNCCSWIWILILLSCCCNN